MSEPPPPVPVVSHRPSTDPLLVPKSSDTAPLGRSVDLKKSGEVGKSDGPCQLAESQVQSEVRWSRPENFPQSILNFGIKL